MEAVSQRDGWLKVGWYWNGTGEPREDVFLQMEGEVLTEVTATAPVRFADWSQAAIIPRLVNAHCHLEFSHLHQPLTPSLPFSDWIGKTVASRRSQTNVAGAIQQGRQESRAAGVGLLAEIVTHTLDVYEFPEESRELNQPELTLFQEILAFRRDELPAQLTELARFLDDSTESGRRGVSPHAPYTVCLAALREILDVVVARDVPVPVMMHLAETQAERELLAHRSGELVEMLDRIGLWQPVDYADGLRPLDYLRELARAPRVLIAHGNYLDDDEIDFLAETPHIAVVYCPRTHAFFQHAPHQWQEMRARGICIALGTDGRGSNPDLDLWSELHWLRLRFPAFNPLELLEMATTAGGTALGRDVSLTIGQPAVGTLILPTETTSAPLRSAAALFDQPTQRRWVRLGELLGS